MPTSAGGSEWMVRLSLGCAALAGLAVSALLMRITWLRIHQSRWMRREQRVQAVWRPLLAATLMAAPTEHPELAAADQTVFLELWNRYYELTRGEARDRLVALARRLNLEAALARGLAEASGGYVWLLMIITLGRLGAVDAWEPLLTLARRPGSLASLVAARSLLQIDAARAITCLLPLFLARPDWSDLRIGMLLQEVSHSAITSALIEALPAVSVPHLPRLVRLLDATHCREALPALRQRLDATVDAEALIPGLQMLASLGDAGIADRARKLAAHPDWRLRETVAGVLGRYGSASDLPLLLGLVRDPAWPVRHRAARAIVLLPGVTPQWLMQMYAEMDDRFGRDMLQHAMAEVKMKDGA